MKKIALVFVVAVLVPSLVLAWLAVRSLRDQQFLLERQQLLLDQRVTDGLATEIASQLAQQQQEFSAQVENLMAGQDARAIAVRFDNQLRQRWPLAEVGFCVTMSGKILSPVATARTESRLFVEDNGRFLGNLETAEVYGLSGNAFEVQSLAIAEAVPGNAYSSSIDTDANVQISPQATLVAPQKSLATANSVQNSGQNYNRGSQNQSLTVSSYANIRPSGDGDPRQLEDPKTSLPADRGRSQQILASTNFAPNGGQNYSRASQGQMITLNSIASLRNAEGGRLNDQRQSQQASVPMPTDAVQSQPKIEPNHTTKPVQAEKTLVNSPPVATASEAIAELSPVQNFNNGKTALARKVSPQGQPYQNADKREAMADASASNLSRVVPAEAEFRELVGNETDGLLARFLQNKLKLMFWHRLSSNPDLIFGAQLNLNRVVDGLRGLMQPDPDLQNEICLALLDDNAKPVAVSRANFQANWKRPFVATEIGDALPHWEVAAYLINPAQLTQAAHTARLTLGLLVAVLLLAIGIGSWLIVSNMNAELKLARQKTDFVSNVSHELKTPLTSIRMFSELLAEGRVLDAAKQRSYLNIISAEAARLTRLINNVLDFSRLERGEKKYNFQSCDLAGVVRAAADSFRPHLEANGFKFDCELPAMPVSVRGDADALSQIIVNLLSNAEKYSNGGKEIVVQVRKQQSPLPYAEIKVLDRGSGVPHGSGEKIFEKFYRAHDSLGSGIQGSGLGLTIARQIARAHGGDVVYEPRDGGGSCFALRLPVTPL